MMEMQKWYCGGCGEEMFTRKIYNKHRPFCNYCGERSRMEKKGLYEIEAKQVLERPLLIKGKGK